MAREDPASVPGWLSAPKPTPARRNDLPAAFRKPAPSSISDLKLIEEHVKRLVARVSPAVVAVEVGYGNGSGVVISADGLVLTAGHVSERPNRDVVFTFPNGKTARGKTLGSDRDSDTGLMRITDSGSWPFVATGDLDQAALGDWVLALGHPGGFDAKRSLVVRLGRIIRLGSDTLQTDCPISPGDSGGPLVDMHGRVIGIHSAISSAPAENFHVTISEFYDTWTELAKGDLTHVPTPPVAYFGARGLDTPEGCQISAIDQDSPAFRAGLQVGDIVLKIEGRDIRAAAALRRWVSETRPGERLTLEVKRGDQALAVVVKLEAEARHN
jgi:serine protease Do